MNDPLSQAFWLLCGMWSGIGGALFTWFSLRKKVASGEFSHQEVVRFAKGMALWIFVPCLILWGLQTSIGGQSPPYYTKWPAPQKYIALALQVILLGALAYWVFFRDGAATLSRFCRATSKAPAFMNSPVAMKLGVIAAVAGAVVGAVLSRIGPSA
ncbi:hypothetical protein IV454_28525 [Massilia antarctica]|uniref:Uncharacterized protein n=1 Tax=Massilia antarctica TaxID=2765360 RepID=A0AA48WCR8_9BURK|nr:hypothetical protein [Massilia antarctica]QPI49348.1 hypothetical protein IV454_28525 [Massilia antarctica]